MPLQFLGHADDLVKVRQLLLEMHVPSEFKDEARDQHCLNRSTSNSARHD